MRLLTHSGPRTPFPAGFRKRSVCRVVFAIGITPESLLYDGENIVQALENTVHQIGIYQKRARIQNPFPFVLCLVSHLNWKAHAK